MANREILEKFLVLATRPKLAHPGYLVAVVGFIPGLELLRLEGFEYGAVRLRAGDEDLLNLWNLLAVYLGAAQRDYPVRRSLYVVRLGSSRDVVNG